MKPLLSSPVFLLIALSLVLAACETKPTEQKLDGWVDVNIDYWHYTPHIVFVLVDDPSQKRQRADSIRIFNLTDDTTYIASKPLQHPNKPQYGFEFNFPDNYLATILDFPEINRTIYDWRWDSVEVKLSASLHF